MSIIGCFQTIDDNEIAALRERPERVWACLGLPSPTAQAGLFDRLFKRPSSTALPDSPWLPAADHEAHDVDKAWHGIHFLLCGSLENGDEPLAFILNGGEIVGEEDIGYGPARVFTSTGVAEIALALRHLDIDTLRASTRADALAEQDIYPDIWAETDSLDYLFDHLIELRQFIERAHARGKGLLVYLS